MMGQSGEMSWFCWDKEDKWTSYNGTGRINGLYLGQESSDPVENHNMVGSASPVSLWRKKSEGRTKINGGYQGS